MNNLRTSPLSSCKNLPPLFFMVHLLHRLYGVDAPARWLQASRKQFAIGPANPFPSYLTLPPLPFPSHFPPLSLPLHLPSLEVGFLKSSYGVWGEL